jgi:two-component system, NarL family, invasion response regulator UvrY
MVDVASAEQRALGIRLVNVEIRLMVPEREAFDPDGWDFFCECGSCRDHVRLPAEDFDRRVAGDELVLAPGHVFVAAAEARRVAHKLRSESQALQAQARQAVRRAEQGLRQAAVLVVDDSVTFLRAAGAVVSAARELRWSGSVASGEEAIRDIPLLKPDLVLLDVHMPGISGVETARIIHRQHPEIVIVLISTETAGLAEVARSAGAAALLNKAELTPAVLDAIWLKHRLR